MFCRQCGNRLEVGSLFCASCGAKTNTPASEADPTREKEKPVFSARTKGFFESLEPKGFFESLFDFSFTSLVTTKLIKFLYALSIPGLAVASLFFVIIGFIASPAAGVIALLFSPLFFFAGVCYMRLTSEMLIVVFRISEHTAEIAQQVRIKEAPAEVKSVSQ
jgi:hypothetical protein